MRKVGNNTFLVAENDDAQILFYEPEHATRSVVTFNDMTTFANGRDFWAESACKKLGYRTLGVMSKRSDWFPTQSVGHLIDSVMEKGLVERPIAYGFSMGGHAALKFGRRLDAKYAVAFSPQWSIAPQLAPVSVSGYSGNFIEGTSEEDVTIYPDQMPQTSFCIYDSKFGQDRWNIARIKQQGPVHLLDARHTEHFTVHMIASSARLEEFFCAADRGDLSELTIKLRGWKKNTVYYLGRMGISSAQNHKKWSAAIFERLFQLKPGPSAKRFKFEALIKHGTEQEVVAEIGSLSAEELKTESLCRYILYMLKLHKFTTAYQQMLNAVPVDAVPLADRVNCLNNMMEAGEFSRLAALTNLMISQGDNEEKAHYLRAVALLKMGFEAEAEFSALAAAKKIPNSIPIALFLSNLMVSRKKYSEAFRFAEERLAEHPRHPSLLTHLAYVAKSMGDLDTTKLFATRALEVDPNIEAAKIMLAS